MMLLQAAFAHMDELKPEETQNTPHATPAAVLLTSIQSSTV